MPLLTDNVIRFKVGRFDLEDSWTRLLKGKSGRKALRKRLTGGGPTFRTKLRSSDRWSPARELEDTMVKVEHIQETIPVGETILVQRESDQIVIAMRKVRSRLKLPIQDTAGNSDIDRIYSYVVATFAKVYSMGICNRRLISGTSTWSQHAPYPNPNAGANAWDIGASFALLKKIAGLLVKHADKLNVGRVIFNRQVWDREQGWHPYTGADPHTSHIHVEGRKERKGQPLASC